MAEHIDFVPKLRNEIQILERLIDRLKTIGSSSCHMIAEELSTVIEDLESKQRRLYEIDYLEPIRKSPNETLKLRVAFIPTEKITSIKMVRKFTAWGLKESKEFVESNDYIEFIGNKSVINEIAIVCILQGFEIGGY